MVRGAFPAQTPVPQPGYPIQAGRWNNCSFSAALVPLQAFLTWSFHFYSRTLPLELDFSGLSLIAGDPGRFRIQTSTEEFIFRAYLPQGITRFTPRFWLPWIIPAVVFGLLHSLNPEVDTYGFILTIPFYIGFGLLLGWITLRSRSLELALGLHLANNLYASLIVTFPGSALPSCPFTIQSYDAALSWSCGQ